MNYFKDDVPKDRILAVLKLLIDSQNGYTTKELANQLDVDVSTVQRYLHNITNAGFNLEKDKQYRNRIVASKSSEHLDDLLYFSQKDQDIIYALIADADMDAKQKNRILQKLEGIYDFTRLGHKFDTSQILEKISMLEQARKEQLVIKIKDYASSNSGTIADRYIEPYHIVAADDLIHGFDINVKEVRHFKISRIHKLEITKIAWDKNHIHHHQNTDPFGISADKWVHIKLRLTVGGVNELIQRFPKTQGFIKPTVNEEDMFELSCQVNSEFIGITNFILGNHHLVEAILENELFIEHVNMMAKRIQF